MNKRKVSVDGKYGEMVVTSVQVNPIEVKKDRKTGLTVKALVRVLLNDSLQMTAIRVVEGSNGLFVSYPNDPSYVGSDYRSLFYPVTKELRDHIDNVVLLKYRDVTDI